MGAASYPGNIAGRFTHPPRRLNFETVVFGGFELKTETGELWKDGVRRRLQQKPLQILEALLDRPGELVTRDELCQKLWPDGTFVDYESGLNTAINRLRGALGDSAEAPQFIETLPRLGYRFICPVTRSFTQAETEVFSISEPQPEVKSASLAGRAQSWGTAHWSYKAALLGIAAAAMFALVYLHSKQQITVAHPIFRQLTFRTGNVADARFIPRTQKVAYTARWQGGVRRTYLLDLQNLNSYASDETPNGLPESRNAAIVRSQNAESNIEFPAGHVVYNSRGWITNLRVSPHGDQVAFFEHPVRDDDGGYLRVVDRKGNTSVWTQLWSSAAGLAWSQGRNEVWFTASKQGMHRALYASSGPGKLRLISQGPSPLRILDISEEGQALIALDDMRMNLMAALPGEAARLDLSKFDCSHADDISPDGRFILFTESSGGADQHYISYIHDVNSHATVRLAQGRGLALSPDARWAITIDPQNRRTLVLNRREDGKARRIDGDGFEYQWARFLPDAHEILVGGGYPGEPLMICKQALAGGKPKPVEGVSYMDYVAVSSNGTEIAGLLNRQLTIFNLASKPVRKLQPDLSAIPVAWGKEGRGLYVVRTGEATTELMKLSTDTGRADCWKTIPTSEISGFAGLASVVAAPQVGSYAYSSHLNLSRLYIVDGWR